MTWFKDITIYRQELEKRLIEFGLEIEPTKTKLMAFGRLAEGQAKVEARKPETFDFLVYK